MDMYLTDKHQFGSNRQYTDEGFLFVPAKIARTGIQEYLAVEMGLSDRDPMEVIKVYRPPEEVFKPESMASFAYKPVTDNHPEELLTAKTAKLHTVGTVGGEITKDGIFLSTTLHITDAEAIKSIESGKVELSNGYLSDIEWTVGVTHDGERYDAIQRNIRGNHVAIVSRGRCGASCSVSDSVKHQKEEPTMATVKIDGVDYEVSDQVAQAVNKLTAKVAGFDTERAAFDEQLTDAVSNMETMKVEHKQQLDTMQAKLDDAQGKIPDATTLDSLVSQRSEVVTAAAKLVDGYEWQGKDCATIKKEIVASKGVDVEDKSPEYIAARFDSLVEGIGAGTSTASLDEEFEKQVTKTGEVKGGEVVDTAAEARANMVKRNQEAWKKGGNK